MAERADAPPAAPPTLEEASAWIGWELDEAGGERAGRVETVFVDGDGGEPTWLIAALREKRGLLGPRRTIHVAVPARDCAGAAGRVWTAHGRAPLHGAPNVDPSRPLLREHELAICAHYGIGEKLGRAAEVAGRDEGAVTSRPA